MAGATTRAGPLLFAGATLLGVLAVDADPGWSEVRLWIPDLAVGLTFAGAGVYAWPRRRGAGLLLVATGYAWFLGNLWPGLLYLSRGPLLHLTVTYPHSRPRSRPAFAAVTLVYVTAVFGRGWQSEVGAVSLSVALVAFVAVRFVTSQGRTRRWRRVGLLGAVLFAIAVGGYAIIGLAAGGDADLMTALLGFQLIMIAIGVLYAVRLSPGAPSAVADLVVELADVRAGSAEDLLADALDDPTLQLGYRDGRGYVTATGHPVAVCPTDGRVATYLDRDGETFGVLVHDASLLDDPELPRAVRVVAELSADNAELTRSVGARVDELRASRRRLLLAADEERRRLEARMHEDVEVDVLRLAADIRAASAKARGAAAEHLRCAADHLATTIDDLHQLARGLHPTDLDRGLESALDRLITGFRLPVDRQIDLPSDVPPPEVVAAAYYVCAEALSNVVKHSGATRVTVRVEGRAGRLVILVDDDGVGGADMVAGAGLRGLADRVQTLGGQLALSRSSAGGTRLAATFATIRSSHLSGGMR